MNFKRLGETTCSREVLTLAVDHMAAMRFAVLVADDSSEDRFFIERGLKRSPSLHQVGVVGDGQMVQDYLSGRGEYADRARYPFPDLLLLDIDMPHVNGLEVLVWLKTQNFPFLRVVMLSGSLDSANIARALELGADYCQAKNVDRGMMEALMRRLEILMILLERRDPKPPSPFMNSFKTLNIVDGRGPPWEAEINAAADTKQNFILILKSEQDLDKLWAALGTTNILPDRLNRWGVLAM